MHDLSRTNEVVDASTNELRIFLPINWLSRSFTWFCFMRSPAWARSLPQWSMTRQVVWQTWCTNKSPTVSFGRCPISPPKLVGKILFWFPFFGGIALLSLIGGLLLPDFPLPTRLALPSSKWFRRRPWFFSDLVSFPKFLSHWSWFLRLQVNNFTLETNNNVTALQQTVDRTMFVL